MKSGFVQKRIYWLFAGLSLAVLLCFSWFYVVSLRQVEQTNETYVAQVSVNIMATLQNTFLTVEHCAVNLATSQAVSDLLAQDSLLAYHTYALEVQQVLDGTYQPDDLVENILIYDQSNHYYRLRGELGNTACDRIGFLLAEAHEDVLSVQLTGVEYIGYIVDIYSDEDVVIGALVFLIRSEVLEDLLCAYTDTDNAQISFVSSGTVLVSSDASLCGQTAQALEAQSNTYLSERIGYTPFEIVVVDQDAAVRRVRDTFLATLAIACVVLCIIVLTFYIILHRHFFSPVLQVIDNLQSMGATRKEQLVKTGTQPQDFARMVEEISEMIARLDQNAKEMLALQSTTQMAQIEKQTMDIELLKKQINVHFLINTISVIKRLSERGDSENAGVLCIGLAQLLRYANSTEPYVQAVEEMHMMEDYLKIMRLRQPRGFTWTFALDEQIDALMLPRMLIQPLVENAITHGIEQMDGGEVVIRAQVSDTCLTVQVQDNGNGISIGDLRVLQATLDSAASDSGLPEGFKHISLGNIQKRVRFFCGDDYGLQLCSTQGEGTTATLTLPLIEE